MMARACHAKVWLMRSEKRKRTTPDTHQKMRRCDQSFAKGAAPADGHGSIFHFSLREYRDGYPLVLFRRIREAHREPLLLGAVALLVAPSLPSCTTMKTEVVDLLSDSSSDEDEVEVLSRSQKAAPSKKKQSSASALRAAAAMMRFEQQKRGVENPSSKIKSENDRGAFTSFEGEDSSAMLARDPF